MINLLIILCIGNGEVYSWGNNENGQCGVGNIPFQQNTLWAPKLVKFDDYQRPFIKQISCGSFFSGFVDGKSSNISLSMLEIGRLFMCGKGDQG